MVFMINTEGWGQTAYAIERSTKINKFQGHVFFFNKRALKKSNYIEAPKKNFRGMNIFFKRSYGGFCRKKFLEI